MKNVINGTIGKFIMLEKLLTIRSFTHIKCYLLPYIISIVGNVQILKRNHQLMPGSALIVQRKKNLDPCNYSIATCRPYSCYIHYSIFGFTLLKHSYSIVFDISI